LPAGKVAVTAAVMVAGVAAVADAAAVLNLL
jgi:hypothetical protein